MTKPVAVIFSLFFIFSLFACAHSQPEPERNPNIAALEKKLAKTNEKLDEMVGRVSELQLMVDAHQRSLQDLKADNKQATPAMPEQAAVDIASEQTPAPPPPPPPTAEVPTPIPAAPAPDSPGIATSSGKPIRPAATKTSPEALALYYKAFNLFKKNNYREAIGLFDTFSARYPSEDLADNALYWAGECHYGLKDYAGAVQSFKYVLTKYPYGNKMPDAMLKLGYAYLALGDRSNGTDYLKKVIKNYPFSPAALKAEEKLRQLPNK